MEAGRLRRRVTIKEKSVTRNSYGEEVVTWTTVDTVWSEKVDLSGQQFIEGRQLEAQISTRFKIRYLAGVSPAMRIIDGSESFDIHAVIDPDGRMRELNLMCAAAAVETP